MAFKITINYIFTIVVFAVGSVSQVTSKNRGILYTRENKAMSTIAIFARPYVQIVEDLKNVKGMCIVKAIYLFPEL